MDLEYLFQIGFGDEKKRPRLIKPQRNLMSKGELEELIVGGIWVN